MTYRERRGARMDRLEVWAAAREARAADVFRASEPFSGDYAFNTQPGHIPFRAKLIAREDRAHESIAKAHGMKSRADGIRVQLDSSIYSDDADAVPALEARITALETKRATIKARNAEYKKTHAAELKTLPPYQRDQAMPYQGFELTNLSGNINRQKKRLVSLRASRGGAVT